jgi:hypothetical protein
LYVDETAITTTPLPPTTIKTTKTKTDIFQITIGNSTTSATTSTGAAAKGVQLSVHSVKIKIMTIIITTLEQLL